NIVVNLDSSSDNNNSDSYSTSEEIDYDSLEPPKSLLKWYHYLLDEYKNNGRFWGSKSGCNESDVKPSWKDIKRNIKHVVGLKAQASEASSKAKVEACGSKAKAKVSPKTLIVKSPVPITNYALGLANAKTKDGRGSLEVESDVNLLYDVMIFGPYVSLQLTGDGQLKKSKCSVILWALSTQGLLDAYGCDIIKEYLEWNYFPRTDNESTNMETRDKGNTDKDCIDDSNSAMSKGCVLGLASVTTWDEIEKKMGAKKSITCADKAKGKSKGVVWKLIMLAHVHSRGRKSHSLISSSIRTLSLSY
ncbi:hypothetical protein Tco_1226369, partial [Tanacetum coccineum]